MRLIFEAKDIYRIASWFNAIQCLYISTYNFDIIFEIVVVLYEKVLFATQQQVSMFSHVTVYWIEPWKKFNKLVISYMDKILISINCESLIMFQELKTVWQGFWSQIVISNVRIIFKINCKIG